MDSDLTILGNKVADLESYTATDITELIVLIDDACIDVQGMRLSANHTDRKLEKFKFEIVDKFMEICSRLVTHYRRNRCLS